MIARLPASSLTVPVYHQLAALVHLLGSWQDAAEQTLHGGGSTYHTLLHCDINGKRKGEINPQKVNPEIGQN